MIIHSAKEVRYDIKNFIEKNIDQISGSLDEAVKEQTGAIVKAIYNQKLPEEMADAFEGSPEESKKKGASALKTIWSKFNRQMQELMEELAATPNAKEPCDLHFIRCIKPNEAKKPNQFVQSMTLQQIRYMGVLESIEVKRQNYPNRRKFKDFYQRYEDLSAHS